MSESQSNQTSGKQEKRVAAGETGLHQRMEQSARRIVAQDVELFGVVTCGADGHPQLAMLLSELKAEITTRLKELRVTERIVDKLPDGQLPLAHYRFSVALSGCMNGCIGPEMKSFGVAVASVPSVPTVADAACSECFACVDACRRGALVIRDGSFRHNIDLCDHCSDCVRACTTGKLVSLRQGFKIFIGGRGGRYHQPGFELFKMADRETLFKALEASVEYFLTNAIGQESFGALLNREGPSPIYQRIYQG